MKHYLLPRGMKFRQKLFVSYLIVVMIPLTLLGGYSYYQSKQIQMQQAHLLMQDNLNKIVTTMNSKIQRFNSAIDLISYSPSFYQIFNYYYNDYYSMYIDIRDTVDPTLNTIKSLNGEINRVTIYTENNLTERVNSIMPISAVEKEPWFSDVMRKAETQWYLEDGKLFGVKRIFSNVDSDKKNLIYLEAVPSKFFDIINDSELTHYKIVVNDQQGNALFTKQKGNTGKKESLTLQKTIPDTGWSIVLYTYPDSITNHLNSIISATIVIEVICFVLVLFIIWFFSKGFVKRIQNLNRKMKLVEQGTLDIPVNADLSDEIGDLELRFGSMLASIKELIDEVYQGKINQKEAELRALQAQINPHFLYNSLSMINWKAIDSDNADISRITNLLSVFYRTTLNRGNNLISVKDELQNTKSYLEIQSYMHDHMFDVAYSVDDSLLEQRMIKLVLQPIVENSIEHGIHMKRSGRGAIRISAEQQGGTMVFTVEDNGPGMEQEVIDDILNQQSRGYGLFNVNERIRIQYGNNYGVKISCKAGIGTKVWVTVPLNPSAAG